MCMGAEHFRSFLWGTKFIIKTDQKPLVHMLAPGGGRTMSARLARLVSKLQNFHYMSEYVPGKTNVHADCMSRLPLPV